MAILGDGEANHFEFQIYRQKRRRFRSEEGNTNLNKFFHFDENVEIYRASGQCLALTAAQAVLEFCMPRRLIDK